jgi:hypothetical protein
MRWAEGLLAFVHRSPLTAVLGGLVVLQLITVGVLAQTGDWSYSFGDALTGALLVTVELVLLYSLGYVLGGPLLAVAAGVVWIVLPPLVLRYWVVGGNPPTNYETPYHEQFLPIAFGFEAPGAATAGCLLLLSGWLVFAPLARRTLTGAGAGAAAGAAAGVAALVHPRVWPALAAPILGLAVARRPRACLACAATAILGLAALAVFRHVPGIHPGWHTTGVSLDLFREYGWSRRLAEYLPLAGLIGLAIRFPAAAAFFGWLLVALIVFPLGRPLSLLPLLVALVPSVPVYVLLTACISLLVPQGRARTVSVPEPGPRGQPAGG